MRILLAAVLTLGLAGTALADPMDDLVKAQNAAYEAWAKVPLTEQKVAFISGPSEGYGMYTERDGNVFKPGEPIITYVEPIGFGWKELPKDMYEINLVVDFAVATEDGTIIGGQKGFSKTVFQSHVANTELKLDLTLNLSNAPAGKYTVTYTIHDMSADQSSSFDQTFEIGAGG